MLTLLRLLINDEDGQGLVEYGLIIGIVSVLAIAALGGLSTSINGALGAAAAAI